MKQPKLKEVAKVALVAGACWTVGGMVASLAGQFILMLLLG